MNPIRSLGVAALAAALLVAGVATAAGTTAAAATTATAAATGTAAAPKVSNKWRLAVDGRASADGSIVLRLTPKDGVATEVTTAIRKGTSENDIARQLVKQLKSSVGKQYHVERDDFEDVLVKKKMGQADFAFELVSSSLPGVNLKFERE
jgi:hypothetical protein